MFSPDLSDYIYTKCGSKNRNKSGYFWTASAVNFRKRDLSVI